ncbi:MAG: hypothetical protein EON96_02465 [Caulobacteraceae bacterium]|nr:MAG: hypothetical protein EON96_02465 [Caulobacteraceae bacterium]
MPQTIIMKGQQHTFPVGTVGGNLTIATIHPASGNITYVLPPPPPMPAVPVVAPLPGGTVFNMVLPVNGNAVTVINNTTSGLSCTY